MIIPESIKAGDGVAIISPATEIKPFWVEGAAEQLAAYGWRPIIMPHAIGCVRGTYAAGDAERLADLRAALTDPSVKGILCSRGGYGCNHLLSSELQQLVSENPKWMVGFSDVSALHALWLKARVMSIHASMAKQLTLFDIASRSNEVIKGITFQGYRDCPATLEDVDRLHECAIRLHSLLSGEATTLTEVRSASAGASGCVVEGKAKGRIVGGNLAVLNGLAATPWDILTPGYLEGKILFLEDVGEKIYQVERMLKRLQLAGVFEAVGGVIFGQFTEYRPDANFSSMEAMIKSRMREWRVKCPVGLNFPIGHTHFNIPIVEGAEATLSVSCDATTLSYGLS